MNRRRLPVPPSVYTTVICWESVISKRALIPPFALSFLAALAALSLPRNPRAANRASHVRWRTLTFPLSAASVVARNHRWYDAARLAFRFAVTRSPRE